MQGICRRSHSIFKLDTKYEKKDYFLPPKFKHTKYITRIMATSDYNDYSYLKVG